MKKTPLRQNVTKKDRQWWTVDAEGKILGDLAVQIANTLRGKNRVDFTPHTDCGDYVVVLNADKIEVTGQKEEDKKYYRHSRRLGNLKTETLKEVREKNPLKILRVAVSGMLPKNRLRNAQLRRLHLIVGSENPYTAQKPTPLKPQKNGK